MFQSENVFLIGLQRTWNTPEYFPRQFALDRPRSVTTVGWSEQHFQIQLWARKVGGKPLIVTFSNFLISPTDNNQKICVGGSLEQRSLARDLASKLATGGEVNVP